LAVKDVVHRCDGRSLPALAKFVNRSVILVHYRYVVTNPDANIAQQLGELERSF